MYSGSKTINHTPSATAYKAITKTLIYSDIFNFPLTEDELWYFLKTDNKVAKKHFKAVITRIPQTLSRIDEYYFLKGKETNVKQREKQKTSNEQKILHAKKITRILSYVPTIMFIGISGSVAAGNASKDADIDLFIIVRRDTLWSSRLLLLLMLGLLGLRRTKTMKKAKNKFCINMILDEHNVSFAKDRQDIYTAHEIAQMKPLFDREKTYARFLSANTWIRLFMPNVLTQVKPVKLKTTRHIGDRYIPMVERLARYLQLTNINKTRTTEVVSNSLLAFHPVDYRKKILRIYQQRLRSASLT